MDTAVTWRILATKLAARIAAGEFTPGSRMPSGDELARQLGVNRNTVHRAVEELQREGLVIRRKGSGTIVASRVPSDRAKIALLVDGYSPVHNFPSGDLLRGIQDRMGENGSVLIADSKNDRQLEERQLVKLSKEVDGILIYPTAPNQPPAALLRLIENGFPIVVIDRSIVGPEVDTVMTDNRGASRHAVAKLIEQGHRRVGFLSFDKPQFSSVQDRFGGYQDAMAAANSTNPIDLVRWLPTGSDQNPHVFRQIVHDTLFALIHSPEPISALFCVQDQVASAAMAEFERLGINIPDEIELATFNDWHPMTLRSPWNVHRLIQRKQEIGGTATSLLLDRISNPGQPPQTCLIDADFVLADAGLAETFASQTQHYVP